VARKEVIKVAAEMLTKNGQTASAPIPTTAASEDELREWVRQHVERVRRLKLHIAWFLLGMGRADARLGACRVADQWRLRTLEREQQPG
jgi:hypothetical protein